MADKKPRTVSKMTLSVTPEDKKLLKQMALDRDTTVSALLHEWLHRELKKGKK